jgi:hypothetical protein
LPEANGEHSPGSDFGAARIPHFSRAAAGPTGGGLGSKGCYNGSMPQRKPINPFYVASLPAGVAFALTACAYVVMTMRGLDPRIANEAGLVGVMNHHGVSIMMTELAVLGVLTFAAIFSDDFWMRRFEAAEERKGENELR